MILPTGKEEVSDQAYHLTILRDPVKEESKKISQFLELLLLDTDADLLYLLN